MTRYEIVFQERIQLTSLKDKKELLNLVRGLIKESNNPDNPITHVYVEASRENTRMRR